MRVSSLANPCETPAARSGTAEVVCPVVDRGRLGRCPRGGYRHEPRHRRSHFAPRIRRAAGLRHTRRRFHAQIATSGAHRPSVIRIREEGLDAFALAALLQTVWPGIADAVENGAMVTVTERSVRVRTMIGRGPSGGGGPIQSFPLLCSSEYTRSLNWPTRSTCCSWGTSVC